MPTSADLTAGTVLDGMAILMNDPSKTQFTNAKMIPYLNMALQVLREEFELNNVPVTDEFTADPIDIPAGYDHIAFNNGSNPSLPDDFVEPKILWERPDEVDPYIQMTPRDSLPQQWAGVEMNQFIYYVWQAQQIRFLPANQDNQIKMNYVRQIFTPVIDANSLINTVNCLTYLEFKGASLCSKFIGENPTRADQLEMEAGGALYRSTGISAKTRQGITIRRRPFRSGYKRRVVY